MRDRTLSLIGALLVICPGAARGQEPSAVAQAPPPVAAPAPLPVTPTLGRVDFGFRGSNVSGDAARYNRYQDLSEGALLDRFRFEKETEQWLVRGEAQNVGYRDQRFLGEYQSIGKLKTTFKWDQIPLFISRTTRSLQPDATNGVLDVDDSIQQRIQNGTLTLSQAVNSATPFDMRSRRDVAALDLTYAASRSADVILEVTNTRRTGNNLQSFGLLNSPGNGISQELGVPVNTRTTDVRAVLEFANARGMLSGGLEASWFDNLTPTVQFDNPLRSTDISGGPSKGLAVLPPANSRVSFVLNGGYKLPGRTVASAALSIGRSEQNEALVPPSINTALVAPPLERASAEARADVASMVYGLNSRPAEDVWLNVRYRYYDYANKTPIFDTVATVGDWAVGTALWETEPLSIKRQTLDLDASFTSLSFAAFGLGYTRDHAARTYRIFDTTTDDVFRVTADSTGNNYVALRLKYEFSRREGSGFQEQLLEEVGEQPDMRHYDIADRDRSRVTGILTVTPVAWLNLTGSVATGHDDYKNSGFGLRDNENRSYTVGVDMLPRDTVSLGASYGHDRYTANQYSRTAAPPPSPQFTDPTRDWWTDSNDTVHTVSANVDLLKLFPRTDVRLSYDLSDGTATYVYSLAPNSTAFVPPATLQQLAPLKNRLSDARADLQYFIRANVALGVAYWYEQYRVEDFALNSTTINTLNIGTSTLYSGYLYEPYTAHTAWLRITYLW